MMHLQSDQQITNQCPVCSRPQLGAPLCVVDGYNIFTCGHCEADYVFPMPSDAELKQFYDRAEWFEGGERGGYENYDAQTVGSVKSIESLLQSFAPRNDLSVLDVGCGYGAHLELAASLGWKCFGVEVSNHARAIAQTRLGGAAYITESVSDLIPHAFDLVLILDVLEHLTSPYALFYSLFSIGAITPDTVVVIATPNAESSEARRNPAQWIYRHPPSHLVYYTSKTLKNLLHKLQFTQIEIKGTHPATTQSGETLSEFAGLVARASGSNFTEFMRERYVPGTWSKIAEYEHLPRYAMAKRYGAQKSVLDFGCGSGYGASLMAQVALSVTGLDIDEAAIAWAHDTHRNSNLNFHRCDDLGQSLPANTFNLVTCFEMIEHVDYATQTATIASISRLLDAHGVLIISTPNPEITKLYGANPYHLREMSLGEFSDLLNPHFPHIQFFEQRVRNSIAFDLIEASASTPHAIEAATSSGVIPLAFIAVCSKSAPPEVSPYIVYDEEVDTIQDYLAKSAKLNTSNFERYRLGEHVAVQKAEIAARHANAVKQDHQIGDLTNQAHVLKTQNNHLQGHSNNLQAHADALGHRIDELRTDLAAHAAELERFKGVTQGLESIVAVQAQQLDALGTELGTIHQSLWYRLGVGIKVRPISFQSIHGVLRLMLLITMPLRLRNVLRKKALKADAPRKNRGAP